VSWICNSSRNTNCSVCFSWDSVSVKSSVSQMNWLFNFCHKLVSPFFKASEGRPAQHWYEISTFQLIILYLFLLLTFSYIPAFTQHAESLTFCRTLPCLYPLTVSLSFAHFFFMFLSSFPRSVWRLFMFRYLNMWNRLSHGHYWWCGISLWLYGGPQGRSHRCSLCCPRYKCTR